MVKRRSRNTPVVGTSISNVSMTYEIQFVYLFYYPTQDQIRSCVDLSKHFNTIVVDNTEKGTVVQNTKKYIGKQNTILYLPQDQNTGYAKGVNIGIREALKKNTEWMVVLNQDINITTHAIEKLAKNLRNLSPGIYGPFAGKLDPNRWTTILLITGSPIPPIRRAGGSEMTEEYISGSCMAIHRDVIEKIGYFYEPYFMYYEDPDFCIRAKKAGFPLVHIPLGGIEHVDTPSLGKGSFLHEYYLARNHLLFVERMAPLRVKMYEYLRLPKTIYEYFVHHNSGGLAGLKDYFIRTFGEKRTT